MAPTQTGSWRTSRRRSRSFPRRGSSVARTLTVSRVRVREGDEAEYLASVRSLARLAEARGWHLWVFRRPDQPGAFLEFSESRSRETHRAVAERPADERVLDS